MTDNSGLRSNKMALEHGTQYLFCHDEGTCRGEYCTLHNRSNHAMRSFPQNWRGDKGIMERICSHGVGHPDPDEIHLDINGRDVHGCDGCGHEPATKKRPCLTHAWYNLPGNYTRKCDNCELEENLW